MALFGQIRENIQIGYYEYSDDHDKSSGNLNCDRFCGETSRGFDYVLKEKGAGLSGGKSKRSVWRAL